MSRVWLLLGVVTLVLIAAFVAAWTGAIGPLVVCGADQAAVCVAWPGFVSDVVWGTFILFFVGMAAWHVWMWRHEGGDQSGDAGAGAAEPGGTAGGLHGEESRTA